MGSRHPDLDALKGRGSIEWNPVPEPGGILHDNVHMIDDDAHLVRAVAEDYLTRLGKNSVSHLRDEETRARRGGDALSAEAWRDIADATALILRRLH